MSDANKLPRRGQQTTMMGKLLSRVHFARWHSRDDAERALWKKNGLDNPTLRAGYKLAETSTVHRDGTEYKELRLYKLVDAAIIKISSEVNTETQFGLENLKEFQNGTTNKED